MEEKIQIKRTRSRKPQWIPVVAALLRKDNKILVGQRPINNSLAGQWEFPGGKIEVGESPEEALARELKEELGIEAEIGDLKLAFTHTYDSVGIIILFFEVKFWKGQPKARHHMMLEWIYPEELKTRPIPEANKKILPRIFSVLGTPWPK
ncbi:MAG: (deoxy)nucleoside triphosphate pyrophosphohydrolase [Bdellovibrionaceae bacterium]|nr:(deoxy)nucleoside triphosphate pyrophosphohydrolase [Pseudobdellovibrionaceae bacterium]